MSNKKEYIERVALLKAIGCENAVKYGNKSAEQQHKSYSSMMLYEIADEINDSPAADVEPVVRCRDCEHSEEVDEESKTMFEGDPEFYCGHIDCPVDGNGFCSAGKRKAHMERSGSSE